MSPKHDPFMEQLRRCAKENADNISNSEVFVVLFNDHMVEEVIPLIQMGFVVYTDKPVLLLVPASRRHAINVNLERLARAIEIYDDALPQDQMFMEMQRATMRLMAIAGMVDPKP